VNETRRILLVDDDLRVHELLHWALRPPRFELRPFADPRRALDALPGLAPDLIICDMMMPTMDGQVFLSLVKRIPELSKVPFLFLTAVRLNSELQAAFDAGADAYLVKPFPLAKLVETVDKILGTARGERSSVPAARELQVAPGDRRATAPNTSSASSQQSPEKSEELTGEEAAPSGGTAARSAIGRRVSTFERDGSTIMVVTKSENRPNLVITTTVSIAGQGIRKLESFWGHPLRRREDAEQVKRQIDLQHARAVTDGRREPLAGTRRSQVWSRMARFVRR
jgi:CheY-like chemotaxis protein